MRARVAAFRSSIRLIWCGPLLLSACAAPLYAQSGRHQPQSPSTSAPNTQRQRRVKGSSPKPDALPGGQPATPDDPRLNSNTHASSNSHSVPANGGVDTEDVIRVNANLVPVAASVVDETGHAVTDLQLKDFELLVDGQSKPIGDLSRAETPVRMALLFDNSSSLTQTREFEKQAAIRFFRRVMRPVDQAAIYSISTTPVLEQPLTNNVQTLVRTIEHFGKPEGATAMFDTIIMAADYLRLQQGRKVIVIVSDGVDTISDHREFDEPLQRAQSADCQIYAVQTGLVENANLHDLIAERRLQEFAAQTGGGYYAPKETNDLNNAFAQIAADLSQQYVLSYYPDDDRRDGRFRIISLRVATRTHVRVRARRGYYSRKEAVPVTDAAPSAARHKAAG